MRAEKYALWGLGYVLVLSAGLTCDSDVCPATWIGDGYCDLSCMTAGCNWDSGSSGSDCAGVCLEAGCGPRSEGDPLCRAVCNTAACGWDWGNCGVCVSGCKSYLGTEDLVGNGVCDDICHHQSCSFDGGDCVLSTQGTCAFGCFSSMLGDGTCDMECMSVTCENDKGDCDGSLCSPGCYPYLRSNGICDTACHTSNCNWDDFDCDCSPGCTSDLLTNSICDSLCDSSDCQFDMNFCVLSIQGTCASGCFSDMINDGVCDSACYNSDCEWDGKDCGCAADCAYSDLGTCKSSCLVPDCNYDQYPTYPSCSDSTLSLAALNYHLLIHDFTVKYDFPGLCTAVSTCSVSNWQASQTTCVSSCNTLGCVYSQGHCVDAYSDCSVPSNCAVCGLSKAPGACLHCLPGLYQFFSTCVSICPVGFQPHSLVPSLCYPVKDTSTLDSPFPIYVQSTSNPTGNGSYASPFDTLAAAFDAVWMKYTVIYLLSGTHILTNCTLTPYIQSWTQSTVSFIPPTHLTISGFLCDMDTHSPPHALCSQSDLPVLRHDNLHPVSMYLPGDTTLQHLTIWSGTTLVPGCDLDTCIYCPAVTQVTNGYVNDRGKPVSAGMFAAQGFCTPFRTHRFITLAAGTKITIWNVTFSHFMQGYGSLISFTNSDLNLTSVRFTNVTISLSTTPLYSTTSPVLTESIIVQSNPTSESFINRTLILDQITVFLLNNGYEYDEDLTLGGFISIQGLRNVLISNSVFSYSLCFRSSLLTVGNFLTFSLNNTQFNVVYVGIFILGLTPSLSLHLPSEMTPLHILLSNVTFTKCAASLPNTSTSNGALVNIYFGKTILNVELRDVRMTDTFAQGAGLYISAFALSEEDKNGFWVRNKENGVIKSEFVPGKWVLFNNLTVERGYINSAFTFILLYNMANIVFDGLYLSNTADASGIQSINTKSLSYFSPTAYLSLSAPGNPYTPCYSPILLYLTHQLTIVNFAITDCMCLVGNGGVLMMLTTGKVSVRDGVVQRVSAFSPSFASCLHLVGSEDVSLSRVKFDRNMVTAMGAVYVSNGKAYRIDIHSVSFENGNGNGGQLQVQASQNVAITNCTFSGNKSVKEAGVYFSVMGGLTSASFYMEDTVFEGNTGLSGVGFYIAGDLVAPSPLTLQITNCVFKSNKASGSGVAGLIDSNNILSPTSHIHHTLFLNNQVKDAVLHLTPLHGHLDIRNVTCTGSSLTDGTLSSIGCVTCSFTGSGKDEASLTVSDSDFSHNAGSAVMYFSSNTGLAVLNSSNNTFTSNSGRGLYLHQAIFLDQYSDFISNQQVGVYIETHSKATFTGTLFQRNNGSDAGGLYMGGASIATCNDCVFEGNTARSGTGAVYAEQSSEFHLLNGVFRLNTAWKQGAAITFFGCYVNNTVNGTVFEDNSNGSGGTVLLLSSSLTLHQVTFQRNKGDFAPGVLAYFASVAISAARFSNQSSRSGSFLYSAINSTIDVKDSEFSNGRAEDEGGAVYLLSAQLTISNSRFSNISAGRGGLLFASSKANFTLNDVLAVDIITTNQQGGAIYTSESYGFISDFVLMRYENNGIVGVSQKVLQLKGVHFHGKTAI